MCLPTGYLSCQSNCLIQHEHPDRSEATQQAVTHGVLSFTFLLQPALNISVACARVALLYSVVSEILNEARGLASETNPKMTSIFQAAERPLMRKKNDEKKQVMF